ncbi:thiamine-phosphate kinase [Synoicihabitans lomoniglobus]|uniref:Thiamine-monophosphate kinase n=1 Tax=Synoicihabitans lomoniglobus TaxID=2909285 RepID=A0AAF0I3S1_9BACT|nr:thiamine-phosphate kinase [Opitutaceae bacterium LMO-M01]WED66090.1 thiamine-phosphate kinase [Opitutaceae bacterium LMO-M01]
MSPFTKQKSAAVSAWGEVRLIQEIRRWLGTATPRSPAGIGDDCATLAGSMRDQLLTVDPVIYGEHFDDNVPAKGVGAKLFNRNISDIAAMGGRPRAAVIALALSDDVKITWLREFYRSLAAIARLHHVPIIGGDIAHQPAGITATMTLIGEATEKRVLTRQGAAAEDWIFTTGKLGGSRLGWHWKFTPRLLEGQWLVARPDVRSMMDVSDGVAKDIWSLTPRGCRPALNAAAIPVSRSARLAATTSQRTPLAHALTDGEDYELLFTVNGSTDPAEFITAWRQRFRSKLSCIGQMRRKRSRRRDDDEIDLDSYHGFEHLR